MGCSIACINAFMCACRGGRKRKKEGWGTHWRRFSAAGAVHTRASTSRRGGDPFLLDTPREPPGEDAASAPLSLSFLRGEDVGLAGEEEEAGPPEPLGPPRNKRLLCCAACAFHWRNWAWEREGEDENG